MRKSIAIGSGSVLTAVTTHGIVSSGMDLGKPLPPWTYEGFFQHVILGVGRLWSYAHGWTGPGDLSALTHMGNLDDFGRFLAHAVFLVCPLLGFLAFSLVSRARVTWQWWKPLAIAVVFTTPLQRIIHDPLRSVGLNEPLAEAARATMVFVLMVWIGAVYTPRWLQWPRFPLSAGA
jgi:hypothetical protein